MSGDNFHFDLTGVPLPLCLQVAFLGHEKGAVGWSEVSVPDVETTRLVLFWTDHPSMTRFPGPMGPEEVEPMIKSWLSQPGRYGPQPDHDGDNGKGWRVFNEAWTHVSGMWQAFVAIEPAWIMYGK